MKPFLRPTQRGLLAVALAVAACCGSTAHAQTVPISDKLFGVNYWYFDYTTGADDTVIARKDKLIAAGLKLVRIGGNAPNQRTALSDIPAFDIAIDRIVAMGMTPVLQVPINLAPANVNTWITHFKAKGIKYWAVGNEPDPSADYSNWYLGLAGKTQDGNNYVQFRDKFVALASAIKQVDYTAVVIGPDFRQFFGTTDPTQPLLSYYKAFIADVGARVANGVPLLDVYAFHFYGSHTESENRARMGIVQGFLDTVNASRTSKLVLAVGEVNGTNVSSSTQARPWSFEAGQFLTIMIKNLASYGGVFITPWSVYEFNGARTVPGTDFSLFNTVGSRRSTMEHMAALSLNRRDFYMESTKVQTALQDQIVHLGMTDANGSTVMLMNTNASTTSMSYAARLNGVSPATAASAQIRFTSKNLNNTEWSGRIAGKSSLMFTFDGTGRRLSKWEYNIAISDAAATSATAAPLVTDLTVGSSVTGNSGTISLAAVLPAGVPRSRVDFLVDGVLKGSASAAPYTLSLDSTTLSNGPHQLEVRAVDADNNVDSAPLRSFTLDNPVNITAQLSWYASGLVYNRATQSFNGTLKLSNNTAGAIAGPVYLVLDGLPSGVTLQNASGLRNGKPYITLGGLAAGSSVSTALVFKNPANLSLTYTPVVYTGNF
jgi:hypothetical protein